MNDHLLHLLCALQLATVSEVRACDGWTYPMMPGCRMVFGTNACKTQQADRVAVVARGCCKRQRYRIHIVEIPTTG